MNGDDDLERRLRGALSRPRADDAVDTDDFLTRVHHGAKVRRVKRGVSIAAVSVLAVAGGGLAINASGVLGGSEAPVASDASSPDTLGTKVSSKPPLTTTGPTQAKHTERSTNGPTFGGGPATIVIAPHGPIAAADVHPLSLTATGTVHQWVLAKTPGKDCGQVSCATVFATDDHGTAGSWTDVGQLPAPPATADTAGSETVSQLRFTKRGDDSGYDGWAYGNALWSTHDSGKSWSTDGAPAGNVTQLESWGDFVYAGVSSPVAGQDTATLYRSPTTEDAWKPVKVSPKGIDGLTSVQALVAAKGLVALIDSGSGVHASTVYVSTTGTAWQHEQPCPPGSDPTALSAASDATGTIGSLWVTCQTPTRAIIRFTDTTRPGSWSSVANDSFPPAVVVAAQSPQVAFVAGDNVPGIQMVSATQAPTTVPADGVGLPVMFGFTNDRYGYLINSSGTMLSTITGGTSWAPYAVSDTP